MRTSHDQPEGSLRSILTLLSSNGLGTAVAGLFFIVASLNFDLEEMGHYVVAISVQWIGSGLVGAGLGVATLRLAADCLARGSRGAAGGIVAGAAATAAAISAAAAASCLALGALAPWRGALSPELLALTALWAGGRAVLDCLRSGLLAQHHFGAAATLMVISAVTGMTALASMLLTGPFTLSRLLAAHAAGLGAAAVLGSLLLRTLWREGAVPRRSDYRALLRYARWPGLSEGTRLLQANLGPLILVYLVDSTQAGLFGLGRYPAYLFDVIALSLFQYWLPLAVREEDPERLGAFLGRQLRLAASIGVGMLALAFLLEPAIPMLGANFAAAAHLFVLNTLDFALLLVVRPIETVYHGLYKPWLELWPRAFRLGLLFIGALLLAPRHGAIGMAWAQVLSGGSGLLLAAGILWRALDPVARRGARVAFWS